MKKSPAAKLQSRKRDSFHREAVLRRERTDLFGCPFGNPHDFRQGIVILDHAENHFGLALRFAFGLTVCILLLEILFKKVAHDVYPRFVFLVIADFFSEYRIVHIISMLATEVVHEPAEWRIVSFRAVEIGDMDAVFEEGGSLNAHVASDWDDELMEAGDILSLILRQTGGNCKQGNLWIVRGNFEKLREIGYD